MDFNLSVWRQENASKKGKMVVYHVPDISPEASFLEMLDILNLQLIAKEEEPIVFDHDCREGICGACSLYIDGRAHGPDEGVTACQLHMRRFKDGSTIEVEPFRAEAFPIIKDLMVDRSAFDRIQQAGGFISVNTSGNIIDGNTILIPKEASEKAFDMASCIGCGACVASCKNASAMLFVSAKISQLHLLPQGRIESEERVLRMVNQMEQEGFGNCSGTAACVAECPKGIPLESIATMNKLYLKKKVKSLLNKL